MKPNHLLLAPLASALLVFLMLSRGVNDAAAYTAGITMITAWWWATEALPIPATSLFPFAAFPLFGVLTHQQAAAGLGAHVILLLMGGFLMAKGLERCGAHKRFALIILHAVGTDGIRRVVFAFMLAAAMLSMWISNTATCLMLMPIALASLGHLRNEQLTIPMVLAIAYACSIGGIATLVGTPPNVVFAGIYEQAVGQEFGFLRWMQTGLPVVIVGLPIACLWLTRKLSSADGHGVKIELPEIGQWSTDEKRVVAVFSLAVVLWITRSEPFGGWSGLIARPGVGDSTVALLGAFLMFLVRSNKGGGLLDWKTAATIPWGVLLMFAAGITIARAFVESGLSDLLGVYMGSVIELLPLYALLILICISITFITEINSNVATTTLVMPIFAAAAAATGTAPELLMVPAALSASCAFMLPVATAPNAIAYATELVTVRQMIREGFTLNLIMAVIISCICYLLLR